MKKDCRLKNKRLSNYLKQQGNKTKDKSRQKIIYVTYEETAQIIQRKERLFSRYFKELS